MNLIDAAKQALIFVLKTKCDAIYEQDCNTCNLEDLLRTAIAQAEKVEPVDTWKTIADTPMPEHEARIHTGGGQYQQVWTRSAMHQFAHSVVSACISEAPPPAAQQEPDSLHLAAMDLARKQAERIAELESEVDRFHSDAMNEKSARQSLEQQLAGRPTYARIGTIYSESWPIVECGWRFALGDMQCTGYAIERAVFVTGST
jgi:hypothetical protein